MHFQRFSVLVLAAAASAVGFAAPAALHSVIVDANSTDPEIVSVRKAGDEATKRLSSQLVEEISSAVSKRGDEAALDVAHLRQVPAVQGRIEGLPNITAFKITSAQLRAAKNKPDAAELLVLQQIFADVKAGRTPPAVVVQRVDGANNTREWRVYRPLLTQPVCLNCHGDLFNKSATFREKIETRYPVDRAVEYNSNEWRGLLRVTVDLTPSGAPKPVAIATEKK